MACVGLGLEQLGHLRAPSSRSLQRVVRGRPSVLSALISCTDARAPLRRRPRTRHRPAAPRAPSAASALAGRSKKVSELGDSALQLGQTIDEVGHANCSMREVQAKANAGTTATGEK